MGAVKTDLARFSVVEATLESSKRVALGRRHCVALCPVVYMKIKKGWSGVLG